MALKSNKLGLLTTKIGSGITPRGGQSVYQNSGTHLIRSQNIYNHKFEKNGLVCISQEIAEKMKSVEIMTDDVLINITGDSVARVYLVPDEILPARVNQHVCILRTKPELNPHYLYYFLINPTTQNHLLSIAGIGGTRNALTKEMLYNLIIEYPDLPTQEKIVKQLNTIKNKIITLENQNHILEQTAQTIFKSWFVDFDRVTEFEDSELGKIPKGWSVKPLSEIMTLITKGTTPTQKEIKSCINNENYVNYLRVQSIGDDDDIDFKKLFVIPESIHSNSLKRSILQKDDIIYTIAGTIGRISIVESNLLPCNTNQAIAILRLKNSTLKNFVFYYMKQKMYRDELHKNIVHAVQANLSLGMISNSKIILPPNYILEKLLLHIDKISQQLKCNRIMIQSLTKTRDALLPKLMSGEIRV